MCKESGRFDSGQDIIKVMFLHVRKGMEFPVAAMAGMGQMLAEGEDEHEEAWLFFVVATRAT